MEIYISKSGKETGPFTKEQIVQMVQSGMVTSSDLVCHKDLSGWIPVHQFLGLQSNSPTNPFVPLGCMAVGLFVIVMILRMSLPSNAELEAQYPPPQPPAPLGGPLGKIASFLDDITVEKKPIPPWRISDYVIVKYAERDIGMFGVVGPPGSGGQHARALPFGKWKMRSEFGFSYQ